MNRFLLKAGTSSGQKPQWSRILSLAAVVGCASSLFAQSGTSLRYNFKYKCGGETVEVSHCRHDSDMPGYPRTIPERDYCLVYYPDRPLRGGFTVQSAELLGDVIKKLQACGALPKPAGESASSSPTPPTAPSALSANDYLKQGESYLKAQQFTQAIDPLKRAIALAPSFTAFNDLGIAYFSLKQFGDAASAFRQAAQLNPQDPVSRLNLGNVYRNLKQYDKAVAAVSESLKLKPSAITSDFLGVIYDEWQHNPEAIAAYRKAIELDPRLANAYSNLGKLYLRMNKKDDALAIYRTLQGIDQDQANQLYLAITDVETSQKKPSAEERAEAYKNLDMATLQAKANQGDDAAMKRLSDAYYEKRDSTNGLKWLIQGAQHGDPGLQTDLGLAYEKGAGGAVKNLAEARKWYQKAGEQGLDTAQLDLCQSYASQFNLDQGVLSGAGKDDPQSAITPVQGYKSDVDEAFRWCERGANQGLYLAQWYIGVLNARGSATHPPNYADAYFWLTNGGLKAGAIFRQKVGKHLTDAQRTELEQRAANFHPSPMQLLHDELTQPGK